MLHLVYGTNSSLIFASLVRHSLLHLHLSHMAVHHQLLHHLHDHHLHLLLLVQSFTLNFRLHLALRQIISSSDLSLSGLNPRTLGSFNVFILLNGWICLHGVLD